MTLLRTKIAAHWKKIILSQLEKTLFTINLSYIPGQSVRTIIQCEVRVDSFIHLICCVFVYPDLDSAPLFVGTR